MSVRAVATRLLLSVAPTSSRLRVNLRVFCCSLRHYGERSSEAARKLRVSVPIYVFFDSLCDSLCDSLFDSCDRRGIPAPPPPGSTPGALRSSAPEVGKRVVFRSRGGYPVQRARSRGRVAQKANAPGVG